MKHMNINFILKFILIFFLPSPVFSQYNRIFSEQRVNYQKYYDKSNKIIEEANPYMFSQELYYESAFPMIVFSGIYYYNFQNRIWNENYRVKYRRRIYNIANYGTDEIDFFNNYDLIR